jgi:hypothetical protein
MPYSFKKCLLIVLNMTVLTSALAAQSPDPETVLQAFRDSYNWTKHGAMHIHGTQVSNFAPEVTTVWDFDLFNDRDEKFRAVGTNRELDSRTGELSKFNDGSVWDKTFQTLFGGQGAEGLYFHHSQSYEGSKEYSTLNLWEAGEERWHIEKTKILPLSAFLGYAPQFSKKALYDLLSPDNMTIREESQEGLRSYVLEVEVDEGYVELWLDPEQGFSLQTCVLTKEAGKHLSADGTAPYGDTDPIWHARQTKCVTEITVKESAYVDGHYVPLQIEHHYRHELENDEAISMDFHCELSKVDFNPDFVALKAFEFSVPENTRPRLWKKDGTLLTDFQWKDEQLIADMEEHELEEKVKKAVGSIQTTPSGKSTEGKLSLRPISIDKDVSEQIKKDIFVYGLSLAALVLLICGWLVYGKMKKKSRKD